MDIKDGRMKRIIFDLATKFIESESNRTSLITITDVQLTDRGKGATILFTVFPEATEETALAFLKRQRSDFRDFVKGKSRLSIIPFFNFAVDHGEKNRQRIDELSQLGK